MSYKQIETSREIRLWIGQVIVPGVTVAASMMAIPEVRYAVSEKVKDAKDSIQKKINQIRKKA